MTITSTGQLEARNDHRRTVLTIIDTRERRLHTKRWRWSKTLEERRSGLHRALQTVNSRKSNKNQAWPRVRVRGQGGSVLYSITTQASSSSIYLPSVHTPVEFTTNCLCLSGSQFNHFASSSVTTCRLSSASLSIIHVICSALMVFLIPHSSKSSRYSCRFHHVQTLRTC